jgi:hypothetical protein
MAWFAPVSGTVLNRRVLMASLKDGNDESPSVELESRIDAANDAARREAWRTTLTDAVKGVDAETWQPKTALMLIP